VSFQWKLKLIVIFTQHIFLLNRFAHLGVVRGPLGKDDDAVELAIAADHLLIDSMKDVCIDAVRSMVTEENIWSCMERLSVVKLFDPAVGCHEVKI
jgi:hypothetical protein